MPFPVIPPSSSAGSGVVTTPTVAERTPALELRATWRPERYTRVANGSFATATTGWVVTAGINAAGVSITRITDDGPGDDTTCGELVTDALADSGVNYDLGNHPYYADADHSTLVILRLWLKRASGGRRATIVIGSEATATARSSLEVELLDEWQEHLIAWRPQATLTDAQLAVTTGDDQATTVRIGNVRLYSPLASQVDNGSFLTDTTGWVVDGSLIAGAATSLTRIDGDGMAGLSAELVADGTAGSGADISLGDRLFRADMTHRLRIGLRAITGSSVRLRLGSLGTAADRADTTVTAAGWSWHTLDWTPSADRTDAVVSVSSGAASALTVRISEVEVYESADELGPDAFEEVRGAAFDGSDVPGTTGFSLPDLDGTYTAWNTSSDLHGSVRITVPVWARSTHGGRSRGLSWGRINGIAPDPYGKHAHLTAADGLRDLGREKVSRPFGMDESYAAARAEALATAGLGAWQRDLDTAGPEAGTFYDGTDEAIYALQYLTELNAATGTIHVAEPSPHANVGWVYRTVNRTRLTGGSSSWTITDDSRGPLPGAETRDDSLVTATRRLWRDYEELVLPGDHGTLTFPWGSEASPARGVGVLAVGADPADYPRSIPFLAFTRSDLGSYEPPEPEERITVRRRKGRKVRRRRLRWDDPVFPMTVPAGETRTLEVEFSVMTADVNLRYDATAVDISFTAEPARTIISITAGASEGTVAGLAIIGRAWLPRSDEEAVYSSSVAEIGAREPDGGTDTYIPGKAAAEGIARYLVWRYDQPRLRPVVRDALEPARMLGIRVGDGVTMTQSKYLLPSTRFVVAGIRHIVNRPDATDWHTEYTLEELPADAGPWVTIGGGASAGIGSGRRLAY